MNHSVEFFLVIYWELDSFPFAVVNSFTFGTLHFYVMFYFAELNCRKISSSRLQWLLSCFSLDTSAQNFT